jgi:hypothetical protein
MFEVDSSRRPLWAALLVLIAAFFVVPTGVQAAVSAFRIQDGDGTGKAQVDAGKVRVGDGSGPITVDGDVGVDGNVSVTGDVGINGTVPVNGNVGINGTVPVTGNVGITGKVSSTDAGLLAAGDCDETPGPGDLVNTATIASGKTVTDVVLTNDLTGSSRTTLVLRAPSMPGYIASPATPTENASGRFMALQIGFQSGGYGDFNESVDWGDGVKLTEDWKIYCSGVIGSSQGDGLWSIYGY